MYKLNDIAFVQELTDLCHSLVSTGCLTSPIQIVTQHNPDYVIFRAEGLSENDTWYDWAQIKLDAVGIMPAQMMIFMYVTNSFIKQFKVGRCDI